MSPLQLKYMMPAQDYHEDEDIYDDAYLKDYYAQYKNAQRPMIRTKIVLIPNNYKYYSYTLRQQHNKIRQECIDNETDLPADVPETEPPMMWSFAPTFNKMHRKTTLLTLVGNLTDLYGHTYWHR